MNWQKLFQVFEANSYKRNHALCGKAVFPLEKKCLEKNSKTKNTSRASQRKENESGLKHRKTGGQKNI